MMRARGGQDESTRYGARSTTHSTIALSLSLSHLSPHSLPLHSLHLLFCTSHSLHLALLSLASLSVYGLFSVYFMTILFESRYFENESE